MFIFLFIIIAVYLLATIICVIMFLMVPYLFPFVPSLVSFFENARGVTHIIVKNVLVYPSSNPERKLFAFNFFYNSLEKGMNPIILSPAISK